MVDKKKGQNRVVNALKALRVTSRSGLGRREFPKDEAVDVLAKPTINAFVSTRPP
jgi:hypothetical protein